ncbi:MAG: hypothetical protein K2O14_12430 [Oscillospiraceae bacterium]|nr:hypothetical protein [Oscillospiraceae bacterium]
MYDKKPCRRCLLADISEVELSRAIAARISAVPEEQRTSEEEYNRRLKICRECDMLVSGTCGKCGCYVELRAARAANRCPHENKYW